MAPSMHSEEPPKYSEAEKILDDGASTKSSLASTKSSGFRPGAVRRSNTSNTSGDRELLSEDEGLPGHKPIREREVEWGIGDDARMGLE